MNGEKTSLIVKPPVQLLLAAVVIGGLFYILGQYISSQPQRLEKETEAKREITVTGRGEAHGKPDIARITLGVQTQAQATAAIALDLLGKKSKTVMSALAGLGITEEDIKTTNLSMSPRYDWLDNRQTLRGFEASQNVEVKIRDLAKVGEVLAKTTAEGVNQAGGISFEIDKPDQLQAQAEEEAIADARTKGERLAKALGVRLGRVKTFSTTNSETPVYMRAMSMDAAVPAGAGIAAPEVPSGSQDIVANVTITFEIR